MKARHVLYAGPGFSGRTASLAALCPRRSDPGGTYFEHHDDRLQQLAAGVDVTLSSRVEHVCFTLLYLGNRWFPSIRAARAADDPGIHKLLAPVLAVLPVLEGVVFIADSQPVRQDANLEVLELVLELLRDEGIDPARMPFVFQLNKRELPGVLTVDELAAILATPRCAYVESVAVQGRGVHLALETLLDLVDAQTP